MKRWVALRWRQKKKSLLHRRLFHIISRPPQRRGSVRIGSGFQLSRTVAGIGRMLALTWNSIPDSFFVFFFFAFCLNYLPVHLKRSNTIGVYLVDYSAPVIGTVPFAVGSSFCQLVRLITDWQVLISFARLLRSDPLP